MSVKQDRGISKLREIVVFAVWLVVLFWLFNQTHFRDELRANFDGKPGLIDAMIYSPRLIGTNSYRTALFVWMWAPLLVCTVSVTRIIVKHRRGLK